MQLLRGVLRTIAVAVFSAVAVPVAVAVVVLASVIFLPLPAAIPAPKAIEAGQVSRVYDQNGEEIGQFREFEQNIPIRPEDIPVHLKQAVVSAEDRNFYSHGGVDVRGTLRALWTDLRGQSITQGGSTITQQYVKNAYVGRERTVVRKVREAVRASQIDRQFPKEEILFRYLSSIYLGGGAYGVGAAAETYFRKPVSGLTLSEAATLAGLIPAPSRYDPRKNPAGAELKRKLVLQKMQEQGYITVEQQREAAAQVITVLAPGQAPPPEPHTAIHPARSLPSKYPYFIDYVERYLKAKYGPELVDRGGLRIQTTLDPKVQDHALATVAQALSGGRTATITHGPRKGQPTPLEMSLVAVEPQTGFVKALVGGRDFATSSVNLALAGCYRPPDGKYKIDVEASCWPLDEEHRYVEGGGTGRQPGSSFKPFVLATAFEKGVQPTKVYPAPNAYRIPNCRGDRCTIGNYEGASYGSSDLRRATWKSINTVYAQLVRDVGCKETADMAKKLGITTAWYSPGFHTCSGTYALGVIDVAPLDMAAAYGVFANRGLRQEPTPIVRIEQPLPGGGVKVLEDNREREPQRVLDEVIADNVTDVMRGVITGGTGTRADINRPAAGKTGTAQNNQDSWFVGFTPTLSTAVWVGFRDQPLPMRNIRSRVVSCGAMTGGCLPAATWKLFMSGALSDVPVTEFNEPAPIKVVRDELNRRARTGIDPGPRRRPSGTDDGGPYRVAPPQPVARPPDTTTTTAPPTTTTSTTAPTTVLP